MKLLCATGKLIGSSGNSKVVTDIIISTLTLFSHENFLDQCSTQFLFVGPVSFPHIKFEGGQPKSSDLKLPSTTCLAKTVNTLHLFGVDLVSNIRAI